jgi:hypothetical protein
VTNVSVEALAVALSLVALALMAGGFLYSRLQRWWGTLDGDPLDWEGDGIPDIWPTCPACGSDRLATLSYYGSDDGAIINRIEQCLDCNHRKAA